MEIRALPATDQPAGRPEVIARLLSPSGELVVLADGLTPIRHLSYVELREGKARGNHYHKLRHETFYLISGELDLHLYSLDSSEEARVLMRTGDLVRISPGIVHVFVPKGVGHALEFAPEAFDAADVYRHVLY